MSYCGVLELAGFVAVEPGFLAGFFALVLLAGPSSTTVVFVGGAGADAAFERAVRMRTNSVCCACELFRIDSPSEVRAPSRLLRADCNAAASLSGAARLAVSTTRSSVS